ncbi:MAG: PAS domain-containing protein [Flavobacterium sp.]|uniref:PAS domain-containing protein n=1 Tax=Flavobacterium sp. TaxID=239 RepID=UPI003263A5FC
MTNVFTIPNKEKDYQSYMVYVLTIIWSVVTGVIVSAGFIYYPQVWYRWLTFLCVSFFIAVFNLSLNRFGYTRQASWSLTIMVWLYMTIPCYTAGGIFAPGILSQMSVILTAGFLLGWRGGLAIGLLSLGTDFWLAYLESIGQLPTPSVVHTPITRWIGTIIPFGTILALQYYATNHLRNGLTAMQKEILKKEEALENLKESEERYKSIITVSNTGAWEYHLDTNRVWYSSQYFAMLGLDRPDGAWDDTMATTWIERLHPDDRESATKFFDEFLKGGSMGLYENYFRMLHQNGDWVWIWSRARRLRDTNGNLTNITLGSHIDISERINAEEKIRQSEQLLKKVTSQVPGNTYMFELDENGEANMLFMNRGTDNFNHSIGLEDLEELPGKLREIIHEDDKAKFKAHMKEASLTQSLISIQYRMLVKGQVRWRWLQAVPEKSDDGKMIWYGATQDITPLVDYIASIEQIIFDISHVIRRPISTMMGLSILIIDHELSENEVREISKKLHQISEEMDRFMIELNMVYNQKRQNTNLNIDVSSLLDKRSALFK